MTKLMLMVFLGGGIGSMLRYAAQLLFAGRITPGSFPWSTFAVNLAGSFLIGLFYALSARFHLSDDVRLFLTTGLCGGFTTFSTLSHESVTMIRQGCYGTFLIYAAASIALGVAAAFAGAWAGTAFSGK